MKKMTSLAAFVLLFVSWSAMANEVREYRSPDGRLVARVIDAKNSPSGTIESIVEVLKDGHVIASQNYFSEGGEHGFGVEKAAWTPDSRNFVYSMSSSGGHQAWRSHTYFFSTRDNTIEELDQYLGVITSSNFTVLAPDIVETTVVDFEKNKEVSAKASIGDLLRKKK